MTYIEVLNLSLFKSIGPLSDKIMRKFIISFKSNLYQSAILRNIICFEQVIPTAQTDSTKIKTKDFKAFNSNYYNPLSPAKAAFYSAIVPGMGQMYNKKFWKAPIIWGGMGITTYLFIDNNKQYDSRI